VFSWSSAFEFFRKKLEAKAILIKQPSTSKFRILWSHGHFDELLPAQPMLL
jgi:hypothetical protein